MAARESRPATVLELSRTGRTGGAGRGPGHRGIERRLIGLDRLHSCHRAPKCRRGHSNVAGEGKVESADHSTTRRYQLAFWLDSIRLRVIRTLVGSDYSDGYCR